MIRLPAHISRPLSATSYTKTFTDDLIRTLLKSHHEASRKFKIEEVIVDEEEDITSLILDGGEGLIFRIDIGLDETRYDER